MDENSFRPNFSRPNFSWELFYNAVLLAKGRLDAAPENSRDLANQMFPGITPDGTCSVKFYAGENLLFVQKIIAQPTKLA